jgi:hypothetical protein
MANLSAMCPNRCQPCLRAKHLTGRSSTPRPIDSPIGVSGVLDHPPSRVMTVGCVSAFSRHVTPEFCKTFRPRRKQRAQGKPGARCTRGLVCNVRKRKRTRAYRSSGGIPAFPARWVTAYFVISPVNGSFATVIPRKLASQELSASTAAPGPHDFAVRVRRQRQLHHSRPPHLTARS